MWGKTRFAYMRFITKLSEGEAPTFDAGSVESDNKRRLSSSSNIFEVSTKSLGVLYEAIRRTMQEVFVIIGDEHSDH